MNKPSSPGRRDGSAVARSYRRPVLPPGLETAAGRQVGGNPVSRERNAARFMAAQITRGMRICKRSFTHDGRHHEAGNSWWHVSAIPPNLWDYFAHTTEEIVEVDNRHRQPEGLYGVPARRRDESWRL